MGDPTGAVEVPFVAGAQVALEVRCESQFVAKVDVVGRRDDLRDLGIEYRERAGNRQAIRPVGQPDEVTLEAGDFGICGVIREEQVRDTRIEDRRLQLLDVDEENGAVERSVLSKYCDLIPISQFVTSSVSIAYGTVNVPPGFWLPPGRFNRPGRKPSDQVK